MAGKFHVLARAVVGMAFFVAIFMAFRSAKADGVVGSGTPDSCTDDAFNTALKAGGTITFNCGTSPVSINVLNEKDISGTVTIDGGGRVTLNGRNRARLFRVASGASLTLQKITLAYAAANGAGNGDGGGNGAGVLNEGGTLVIIDSTITASRAEEGGGAIYNKGNGTVNLIRVTLSNNTAGTNGGGLGNEAGTVTLANTTFSANFAANMGGGVFNDTGTVTLINNTIYDNNAGFGPSEIAKGQGGTITLKNSIVANNLSVGGVPVNDNCSGITDGGNNLQFPDNSCGSAIPVSDPGLGTLADNGGFVLTHALKPDSPAVDGGNNSLCNSDPISDLDARNVTRPIGAACDIGAYEADPKNPGKGFDNTACATPAPTTTTTKPTFIPCPAGTVYNQALGECVKPFTPTPLPSATSSQPLCPGNNVGLCPGQQYICVSGVCQQCPDNHLRNNAGQCVCINGQAEDQNGNCVPLTACNSTQQGVCTAQKKRNCGAAGNKVYCT